jgi:hypothetical protein
MFLAVVSLLQKHEEENTYRKCAVNAIFKDQAIKYTNQITVIVQGFLLSTHQ